MALPAPAQAADYVGESILRSRLTNECLDGNFAGDVYTLPCSARETNAHQIWRPLLQLRSGPNGPTYDIVALQNKATKRCLEFVYSGNRVRTTSECDSATTALDPEWYAQGTGWSNVVFYQWRGNPSRKWALFTDVTRAVYPAVSGGYQNEHWKFGW
ncbi:ACP synthase [Herbidospora sp. NEAU-GS84]|uniref:ACP synthase n=1 Tax=Herbidospora solisilvae TaxID=2696284 RepID=A0A7C9J660_9ACTN|nr:ACP synthase [Herbidospora solisilvae]NAS25747.1 ACP synthase [Herbidospora solisilvae]